MMRPGWRGGRVRRAGRVVGFVTSVQGHTRFSKDLTVFAGVDSTVTAPDVDENRMRRLLTHAPSGQGHA